MTDETTPPVDDLEPIVVDPSSFDVDAAWREFQGGNDADPVMEDGAPNWRVLSGSDPGVVSCPVCWEFYWNFGFVQRCRHCSFRFPTDWWPMYSWGCQRHRTPERIRRAMEADHERRLAHPYYRYGFEHPVDDPSAQAHRVDWINEVGPIESYSACQPAPGAEGTA